MITTTITVPSAVPDRLTQTPGELHAAATAFANDFKAAAEELNTYTGEVNATASTINAAATSAPASANFLGAWSDLTGAASVPASVVHSGSVYLLISNVADVTQSEPGVSNDWAELLVYNDLVYTNQAQTFTATQTFSGDVDCQADLQIKAVTASVHAHGNVSGSVNIDASDGTIQTITFTGNTTITTSIADGQSVLLHIIDGDAHTLTFPAGAKWSGGASASSLTDDDALLMWSVGGTLYISIAGSF